MRRKFVVNVNMGKLSQAFDSQGPITITIDTMLTINAEMALLDGKCSRFVEHCFDSYLSVLEPKNGTCSYGEKERENKKWPTGTVAEALSSVLLFHFPNSLDYIRTRNNI